MALHLGDWAARGAAYWPEQLAVVDDAKGAAGRLTYAQLAARADRLAGWLRDGGVGRGDRVTLLAHNGVEYFDALFACGKLGAVLAPLNFRLHPRELDELAARVAPAALLYDDELAAGAAAVAAHLPGPGRLLHLSGPGLPGSRPFEEVLGAAAAPVPAAAVGEEDTLCLLLTGGTTGRPKAACVSYRMVAWNTLTTLIHELARGDVTVVHTPLFHTGGLLVYALPLLTIGGTVVIMRRWDPARLLELIERERVTLFFCVPTQYQDLLACPRFAAADLSSVRFVTSGGAPLPVPLIRAFQAVHPVPFKQGFGMTEFGPGAFSMGPEFAASKAGSIGRPNSFVAARVVDDAGRPAPAGQAGELQLRGPACFSGYFGDPAATRAAFDEEGWFRTGDMARVDEDGFYYIVDRKKDMFISGGENVYPAEIERALHEHPAVERCAVLGVPDERWGQVGRAYVVRRAGAAASAEELLEFLRGRLARYKVPKSLVFVPALPLTAAGKVHKDALRDAAAEEAP